MYLPLEIGHWQMALTPNLGDWVLGIGYWGNDEYSIPLSGHWSLVTGHWSMLLLRVNWVTYRLNRIVVARSKR
ncbi:hypothetical protein WA1_43485 [Scytonema hofmannii PCC 7110]|uniref:Uncharacterized protein n=1 Tax=Scytonema hofmannii PCC 7110 TaxID=128403 RepID=A0A139WVU2_9CYAN|nr:hypothetical protein WA1_43485 [Scytonema hofmannii PCC 7110]